MRGLRLFLAEVPGRNSQDPRICGETARLHPTMQAALGDTFGSLEQSGGPVGGYVVTLADNSRHVDVDAACAYGRALLANLGES